MTHSDRTLFSGPYDSYIICTAPRSGSTLLCNMLAETGVAGRPKSYFHNPDLTDWLAYLDVNADEFPDAPARIHAALAAAKTRGRDQVTGLFGARLQRHSFDFFLQQLAKIFPDVRSQRERMTRAFGRVLYIYLNRTDKQAQAVSYVLAQQTGLWHRAADGTELERTAAPAEPEYDFDRLRTQMLEFGEYDVDWQFWFADNGITPYQISYDSLAADPNAVLADLMAELGLDPQIAHGVKPPVARLSNAVNQKWITRLRADLAQPSNG